MRGTLAALALTSTALAVLGCSGSSSWDAKFAAGAPPPDQMAMSKCLPNACHGAASRLMTSSSE